MIYKELGKTKEKVSAIGLGTWQLGEITESKVDAIRAGLDNGIDFIDTAEIYGTEDLVGEAIKNRKKPFIATKVWPSNFKYDSVIKACESSLKRLGVPQIDLYQLHWPNKSIPIKETMSAMERLVEEGKIRYIGVSNFRPEEVDEANKALKKSEIVSDQVEYSLIVRGAEKKILPYCKKKGLSLIAYSPLGHKKLVSNKHPELTETLKEIGEKYGRSPVQVALNWLISMDNVIAIPKASSKEHVLEDAGAADFVMTKGDIAKLNEVSAKFQSKSLYQMVGPLVSVYLKFKRIF
ncbi:aldo/keto reductase [Candidatus Parvarchaeota archaeon]|nr:aldo/keto reductase [Candidatus Parvarchaeota archaeon]